MPNNIDLQANAKSTYEHLISSQRLNVIMENEISRLFYNMVSNNFADKKSLKFLEIGFNRGERLERFSKHFPESKFVGIEVNELQVKKMQDKGYDCRLIRDEFPNFDEKFDVIYGYMVVHHMEHPHQYLSICIRYSLHQAKVAGFSTSQLKQADMIHISGLL